MCSNKHYQLHMYFSLWRRESFTNDGIKWDLKPLSGPVCCPAGSDKNKNYQNWNQSFPLKHCKQKCIYVVISSWKSFIAAWKNLIEQSEFFAI